MQNTCLFENNIPKGFTVNNLRCKPEAPMITEIEPHREFTISYMKSGECIPRRLCRGVSEQDNKIVLDGFGFLAGCAARSFNWSTQSWVGECNFISSSGSHSVTGGYLQITPYGVKQQTLK
jgi:hypothetical protein